MTFRPSQLDMLAGSVPTVAVLVAASAPTGALTVLDGANTAVFRITPIGSAASTDVTVTVPPGQYRDAILACLAVDTASLPFEFTAIGGRVAVALHGAYTGSVFSYVEGTASWMGFTAGQSTTAAFADAPGSPIPGLTSRVAALEAGGGSGGGGTVALGGAQCWYASPTSTISSAGLGYSSGTGVAAISPLFVDQTLTFSKIGYEVSTIYPASVDYTALLYATADGYPSELLASAVIATGTAGGFKSADITALELAPGTYWIGLWVGAAEGTGTLVNNTGVGILMAHSPTGSGRTGNQRIAAGWKSTSIVPGTVGSSWPSRSALNMGTDYRVPRVALWAG